MFTSVRPYGAKLRYPTDIKIKGLNLVPKITAVANWADMWNEFDWDGWFVPQLDLAQQLGANCVKITGVGVNYTDFNARVRTFLNECWDRGLLVYWNWTGPWPSTVEVGTPYLENVIGLLSEFPNVIGIDVANEAGWAANMTQEMALEFVQVAKDAGSVPVSVSIVAQTIEELSNEGALLVANGGVDFVDFHPYFTTGHPTDADFDDFRAECDLPILVGEIGAQFSVVGEAAQAERWEAVGTLLASAPDILGAIGFSIADYDDVEKWGLYEEDLVTDRPLPIAAFEGWRGRI